MANKNGNYYFDTFVNLADYSCKTAVLVHETLTHFDVQSLPARMEELHQLEHAADLEQHEMMRRLAKEFMPPIEREDIIRLAQELDEVTDAVEDVVIRIYMYNITSIRLEALAFTDVLVRCTRALKKAMEDFHNFKKSKTIGESIIEVNRMEEEGDNIYQDATRELYLHEKDPIKVIAWSAAFDRLEKCCDACEHVANVVESVILNNS